jgi:hypothetical protein
LITNTTSIISPGGFDVTNKAGEIKKESQWDIKRPWTIEGYGATSKAFSTTLLERINVIKKWVNKSEELVGCDSKNPLLE